MIEDVAKAIHVARYTGGRAVDEMGPRDHEYCGRLAEAAIAAIAPDARLREALEEAAKIAESHAVCGCNGKHGTCYIDDAPKAIAEEIRALDRLTVSGESGDE